MDGLTAIQAPPSINEPEDAVATVVQAVAREKGVSPLELEPLANALDPDVIEKLVAAPTPPAASKAPELEFQYAGCDVTVTADGHVTVVESWQGGPSP